MAESIKNQVDALTGFASTEDLALQDWCEAGALELINLFPPKLKEKCMTETTVTNSPSYLSDLDGIGEILHVTRLSADSGGYRVPCREVPSMYGEMTGDSSNIMFYATATDPAYWITSSNDATILNINPTPTVNQTGIVYHVAHPQVNIASSEIGNFPDEAGYLVVLYAACRALHRKMNNKIGDLPSDVSEPVLQSVSTSLPSYTSPSSFVLPVPPVGADVSFAGVGSVETFTSPIFSAPTLGTIDSMSLPTAPVSPSMSEKSVTITGTAPTYTQAVLFLSDAPTVGTLSITAVIPVPPVLDSTPVSTSGLTNPTYTAPVMNPPDWSDTNTWISTE